MLDSCLEYGIISIERERYMDTKERFRSIEFTTDNGGVKPIIRNHIKKTAFVDLGVDNLPRTVDNRPYKQIAIDFKTKEPIYAFMM